MLDMLLPNFANHSTRLTILYRMMDANLLLKISQAENVYSYLKNAFSLNAVCFFIINFLITIN